MENKEVVSIPFVAHEAAMNRMERANKRMMILNILELFILLVLIGGIVLFLCLPVDEASYTQEAETGENSSIDQNIGG